MATGSVRWQEAGQQHTGAEQRQETFPVCPHFPGKDGERAFQEGPGSYLLRPASKISPPHHGPLLLTTVPVPQTPRNPDTGGQRSDDFLSQLPPVDTKPLNKAESSQQLKEPAPHIQGQRLVTPACVRPPPFTGPWATATATAGRSGTESPVELLKRREPRSRPDPVLTKRPRLE